MQISDKTKNILNIVLKVFTWILVAFAVFMMVFTIFTVNTVDKNDRTFFGRKFYIVQTDSMSSRKITHIWTCILTRAILSS